MEKESEEEEKDFKEVEDADPLSWKNIETLFGGGFKNTMSKHIQHGRVLLQTYYSLCGYHSYFNMRNTIESLITDDPLDKVYYHLRNNIRSEFWKDYERTRTLLLKKCRLSKADRDSIKNDGSLERGMLNFLLANDIDLIRILGTYDVKIECVPLFFGFGIFQGEKDDIKEAAEIFKKFHNSDQPFVLTIILGVVNHWNVLIAFKRNATSLPLLIYLDSRNIEVLNIDEFDISSFVEQRDKDIRQLIGRPPTAEFYK